VLFGSLCKLERHQISNLSFQILPILEFSQVEDSMKSVFVLSKEFSHNDKKFSIFLKLLKGFM